MKIAVKKSKELSVYTITIHDDLKKGKYEIKFSVDLSGRIIPQKSILEDKFKTVCEDKIKYTLWNDEFYSYIMPEIKLSEFVKIYNLVSNFANNKEAVVKLLDDYNKKAVENLNNKNNKNN